MWHYHHGHSQRIKVLKVYSSETSKRPTAFRLDTNDSTIQTEERHQPLTRKERLNSNKNNQIKIFIHLTTAADAKMTNQPLEESCIGSRWYSSYLFS